MSASHPATRVEFARVCGFTSSVHTHTCNHIGAKKICTRQAGSKAAPHPLLSFQRGSAQIDVRACRRWGRRAIFAHMCVKKKKNTFAVNSEASLTRRRKSEQCSTPYRGRKKRRKKKKNTDPDTGSLAGTGGDCVCASVCAFECEGMQHSDTFVSYLAI